MHASANRLFLLYPPISKAERYSSEIGEAGGNQVPLGVYYLAAYLRRFDYNVAVLDAEAEDLTPQEVLQRIREFSPAYVGISTTTVAFHRALECATEIREQFPDLSIILGGPHMSSNYAHAMSHDVFDFGVLGEGEITLELLLKALDTGASLEGIEGIVYRDNDKVVKTPPRPYIDDIDALPFPALDLIDDLSRYRPRPSNYKKLPVMTIITSRGCPFQCTFCDKTVFGSKFRARTAENVVEEIKHLQKEYGIREFSFIDDTFTVDKKRVYRIFELLDEEGISLDWSCNSRVNTIDEELLQFMKAKGCWCISFGVESGDEGILKLIKKGIRVPQVEQAITWCNELGIRAQGFFMIGHPGETLETIDKTINLACRTKFDSIFVTINTPIPGSPQHAEVEKHGTLDSTDWSQFNMWRPVFVPNGLTGEILLKKQKEMYRRFYLQPRVLLRYFLSFFGPGGVTRFWTLLKAARFLK